MSQDDPTDLARLHDIVMASPAPWWPPAPGWYAVGALIAAIGIVSVWRWVARRRHAAYRRQAVMLLGQLGSEAEQRHQLAVLLRRVALTAYPRADVASLSGAAWLDFLDRTSGGGQRFCQGPGRPIAEAAYAREEPAPDEVRAMIASVRWWIGEHRAPLRRGPS